MFSGLNRVILFGRLGQDVETEVTKNGRPYARLSLATKKRWKNEEGQEEERTDWHRVMVFGPRADKLAKYLKKGQPLLIEGTLSYYQDTDE